LHAVKRKKVALNQLDKFNSTVKSSLQDEIDRSWLEHFSIPDVDRDWYKKLFSYVSKDALVGDFTPDYCMISKKISKILKQTIQTTKYY